MNQKTLRTVLTVVVVAVVLISYFVRSMKDRKHEQSQPQEGPGENQSADSSVHLTLGNPSGATDESGNADNYLMRKPYFALSFNNSRGAPNWVSWSLKESDFGSASRSEFYPDTTLPSTFHRITPRDYTGSGFDRGHMCPRSDRTSSSEAANATFVMSNIVPQSPHVNQRAWNDFEDYCRGLVRVKSRSLYIVSGPQGIGGEGTNGKADTIAGGRVTVPAKCWKVVLSVENGTGGAEDIERVGASSRVIAVVMPNDQSVGHGWAKYRTSTKEVEVLTGYKFFDRVPAQVIDPLKEKVDNEHIPPSKHPKTGE